jgi:methionyl-tRNA formyltransferase
MKRVVIFSPSCYSLYTISVSDLLHRSQVEIAAIFVRRLIDPRRFFSEYSRDGSRLLKKIWQKLVLRDSAYATDEKETIRSFMQREKIIYKHIAEFANRHHIPVIYCNDLNDPVVIQGLEDIKPDLVVFTGGGLIRQQVLENAGAGVLNCHMGLLPQYRGMDVVEWPILEEELDQIGISVHFMDRGVDTGDILRVKRIPAHPGESIQRLRNRIEAQMSQQLVSACLDYLNGSLNRTPQMPDDGRQYFIMHPRLIALAEKRLGISSDHALSSQ